MKTHHRAFESTSCRTTIAIPDGKGYTLNVDHMGDHHIASKRNYEYTATALFARHLRDGTAQHSPVLNPQIQSSSSGAYLSLLFGIMHLASINLLSAS